MRWLDKILKKSASVNSEKKENSIQPNDEVRKQTVRLNSYTDRKEYIKENSGIIVESNRQIEEAKIEYRAVTSYLSDIEKIDRIPKMHREKIDDAARNILTLREERDHMRNRKYDITDVQYRLFERHEMQLPKELTAIKEAESYQSDIEADIKRLENEKQVLLDEEEEIVYKQSFLRGLSKAIFVVILVLFVIFAGLNRVTGANMTLPFLLTVLMGMASVLCIFMEARKNAHDIKIVQLKLNKVIMLVNKVAIKSVNNRNYLEYTYSKYLVDNYEQLKNRWEQYVKIKDENKRFEGNAQLLEFYNDLLLKELKKYNIKDTEIWLYQPSAILDSKEMIEVRNRLIIRRQKLRERIQANKDLKEKAAKAIISLVKAYPDSEADAISILNKYHIKQDILLDS